MKTKKTEYVDQVRVDSSTDGKTVTGSVVMTRGFWLDCPSFGEKVSFCVVMPNAPEGLPMHDETTKIGSPFGVTA